VWFLKSKTSFTSQQAKDATEWLRAHEIFCDEVGGAVRAGYTVNFEWVSPDNQIVIGYDEPRLIVLNARHMETGEYMSRTEMKYIFGEENLVDAFDIPADPHQFMIDAEKMTGIEGFIICFENGLWVKHKTEAYCVLHHLKDSINNPRRLWEGCVNETADDLRAMFHDDPVSIAKIVDMEEKASKVYSHIHKTVYAFYNENKHLDRKDYAIKGQAELNKDGIFSLGMNLYLGKDVDIKGFMVKNYKKYGIRDEETNE
jgi:T4 RnlA family RNA ligase